MRSNQLHIIQVSSEFQNWFKMLHWMLIQTMDGNNIRGRVCEIGGEQRGRGGGWERAEQGVENVLKAGSALAIFLLPEMTCDVAKVFRRDQHEDMMLKQNHSLTDHDFAIILLNVHFSFYQLFTHVFKTKSPFFKTIHTVLKTAHTNCKMPHISFKMDHYIQNAINTCQNEAFASNSKHVFHNNKLLDIPCKHCCSKSKALWSFIGLYLHFNIMFYSESNLLRGVTSTRKHQCNVETEIIY